MDLILIMIKQRIKKLKIKQSKKKVEKKIVRKPFKRIRIAGKQRKVIHMEIKRRGVYGHSVY